jgi:hypothetical protein
MTNYTDDQLTGLSGEYLFGNRLIKELGWIYRTQHIADLGIDGEIEILDSEKRSTGKILKVQIKTSSGNLADVSVDAEHFAYWTVFSVPVIVISVSLATGEVKWWPAKNGKLVRTRYHYKLSLGSVLDRGSYNDLMKISASQNSDILDGLINLVHRAGESIGAVDPTFTLDRDRGDLIEILKLSSATLTVIQFLAKFGLGKELSADRIASFEAKLSEVQGSAQRMLVMINRESACD